MDTVITRPERAREQAAVRAVLAAAFPTHAEADLVDALRGDPAWIPDLSWVAEDAEGEIVGYALLSRLVVGDGDAVALAPVGVHPDRQGKGIGTQVVRAALDAADDDGERLVVVLGDARYYRRFGFVLAREYGVTGPFELSGEDFQALALGSYDGGPRGGTVYPAPFGVSERPG